MFVVGQWVYETIKSRHFITVLTKHELEVAFSFTHQDSTEHLYSVCARAIE